MRGNLGMKAVILDLTTEPGDVDVRALTDLFDECVIYETTTEDEVAERIKDADVVMTNIIPLNRQQIEGAPHLKYIGVMATGYDRIDLDTAREQGIVVTHSPDYSSQSVAQLTMAFMLNFASQLEVLNRKVQAGDWIGKRNISYRELPLMDLENKTLGLIGFGNIAKKVCLFAQAFGMKVIVTNRSSIEEGKFGVEQVELDQLLRESDFISLHVPIAAETEHLIDDKAFDKMKPSAYLINTSRGALVKESALIDAVKNGKIAGAGLDVLEQEPMKDRSILGIDNIYITPHMGAAAKESRMRLMDIVVENVQAFLDGQPQNVVNIKE